MITKTSLSLEEAVESLTGFEELRIRERFGGDIEELLVERSRDGMRAVAAALVTRDLGQQEDAADAAYQHVMGLSMTALNDFFADDEPEAMPDEPDTESGKDDFADD